MAVKIRLARKGRKKKAFYHIVIADSRAPRDGRFIEKLGIYNPNTDPATIEINFDKALDWLHKGAQPTDTCRAILSYKGILLKKHLLDGVRKGAFDEAEADKRFQLWMNDKDAKVEAKIAGLEKAQEDDKNKRLEAEKEINEARAAVLVKRRSELAEAEAAAIVEKIRKESPEVEEKVEETVVEEKVQEEVAPVEEKKAEEVAPVEEKVEETVAEEKKEEAAPVEEKKAEEASEEKPEEKADSKE